MSLSLSTGAGQTTNGPSVQSLIPDVGEYGLYSQSSGQTLYICNTSPTNAPSYLTIGSSGLADVFKNRSDVAPIADQEVRGRSILLKNQEVWTITDAGGVTVARYPAQAHCVISFGLHDNITAAVIGAYYQRLVGLPFRLAADTPTSAFQTLINGNTRLDIPAS